MEYVIYFDIASIFVMLAILVSYCIGKRLHDLQNFVLILMLASNMVSAICDIIAALLWKYPFQGAIFVLYTVIYIYFWSNIATSFSFFLYCICMAGHMQFKKVGKKILVFIPGIIMVLILIIQLIKPCIFSIDSNLIYHRLGAIIVIYAVLIFYTCIGIIHLLKYKKRTSKEGILACYALAIVGVETLLVQYFYPNFLVESFGLSICILLFYLALEKPEELIDTELDILNQKALLKVISGKFQTNEKFISIVLKIHNLKVMRQTLGVDCMNQILRQMAEFMQTDLMGTTVFHFSQSLFVLIIHKKTSEEETNKILNKLMQRYEGTWNDGDVDTKFYIHTSVIEYPNYVSDMDTFINYLQYMRVNSSEHQNSIIDVKDMNIEKRNREMQIRKILVDALENHGFEVFYQPIYSISNNKIMSAEALIRLKDQRLGYISPEEFIPIAEQSGTILKIGEFVFENVCRFMQEENLKEKGIHYIEINLSVVQCMQNNLAERLLDIMDQYGISSDQINLEITETASVHAIDILEKNINMLYKKGIQFSLDDYGSGYSNTDYLFRFPFKIVKIDKIILWEAFKNEKAMIALKNTIQMIKELGLEVVVEGVETLENVEYLKSQNCDFLQGYYYSKPIPRQSFMDLIK